jgi:osmotically-inducible protein OsmY
MKIFAIVSAIALAFGLGACASDTNSSASGGQSGSASSGIKQDTADSMLTGKVKAALASDVGVKNAWNIDVDSSGTTVTLNGVVDSEETKKRAEEVARKVDGVATVKNNLKVEGKG